MQPTIYWGWCEGYKLQLPRRATRNIDNLGMCHQSPIYSVLANVVHCLSY